MKDEAVKILLILALLVSLAGHFYQLGRYYDSEELGTVLLIEYQRHMAQEHPEEESFSIIGVDVQPIE